MNAHTYMMHYPMYISCGQCATEYLKENIEEKIEPNEKNTHLGYHHIFIVRKFVQCNMTKVLIIKSSH